MSELKVSVELSTARNIITAAESDIEIIERYWPESKRGSNASRAYASLKSRLASVLQCIVDAESSIREDSQP